MRNCLIIFDLDGTLLDTIQDLGNAANHALGMRHFPLHSPEEYPFLVGNGIRNLVKRSLPEQFRDNDVLVDETLADFKSYYTAHIHEQTRPYPGIHQLLHDLQKQGYKLAVASNKFDQGTVELTGHFFPDIDFCAVNGNKPGIPLKPSPGIVSLIQEKAFEQDGKQGKTIIVGDSEVDIQTARAAGIPVIAVTWGFRRRGSIDSADRIADNCDELLGHINDLTKSTTQ